MYKLEKTLREDRYKQDNKNPSFSSTLLDAIYRSIDESNGKGEEELIFYRETMRKKHSNGVRDQDKEEMASLQRACMVEKWMEKKVSSEKVVIRRKSMADFDRKPGYEFDNSVLLNSSSSSSESSCGGGFSSSESDSFHGAKSYTVQRPKPIRTSISARPERLERAQEGIHCYHNERRYVSTQKPSKHEGGFVKTKSKALKIYSDLKKVKQPISPGGRIASFLNSIFNTGNAKKMAMCSVGAMEDVSYECKSKSTCSSTTSFSRSCLSKTPSSRGKYSNGMKRSVRFCPVSVIVDEDCRPCGQKCIYENDPRLMPIPTVQKVGKSSPLKEVVQKNYGVNTTRHDFLNCYQENDNGDDDDDDDDVDALSYSSSDLFELDHLIGVGRYREELPVFETTNMKTNQAIANGFFL